MTVPAAYDAVAMTINPGLINLTADGVTGAAEAIVTALNTIGDTMSGLQLSWVGDAADEAQDFASRWKTAMNGMFGPPDNPKAGLINQAVVALLTAAGNYSSCEEALTKMFTDFNSGLGAGGSGSGTDPIPAGTMAPNGNQSAVAEINWTALP